MLWNNGSFYTNTPRFAVDVTVIGSLTVGGSAGAFAFRGTVDHGDRRNDGYAYSFYVLAPRVGYLISLGRFFGVWPRVGVEFFGGSTTNYVKTKDTFSGVSLNIEPTLVFTAFENAAFTMAAVADLPLSGRLTRDPAGGTTDWNESVTNYGIVFGALIHW